MDPNDYRLITSYLTGIGFLALSYLLYTQLRLWPRDRQEWSATIFVLTLWALMGQLCLAYLGVAPLGMGIRGVITYSAWVIATLGFAYETQKHNNYRRGRAR